MTTSVFFENAVLNLLSLSFFRRKATLLLIFFARFQSSKRRIPNLKIEALQTEDKQWPQFDPKKGLNAPCGACQAPSQIRAPLTFAILVPSARQLGRKAGQKRSPKGPHGERHSSSRSQIFFISDFGDPSFGKNPDQSSDFFWRLFLAAQRPSWRAERSQKQVQPVGHLSEASKCAHLGAWGFEKAHRDLPRSGIRIPRTRVFRKFLMKAPILFGATFWLLSAQACAPQGSKNGTNLAVAFLALVIAHAWVLKGAKAEPKNWSFHQDFCQNSSLQNQKINGEDLTRWPERVTR